jgi:hypothetical protein
MTPPIGITILPNEGIVLTCQKDDAEIRLSHDGKTNTLKMKRGQKLLITIN